MRVRHRERSKALLQSIAELEACCLKLESELEQLRLSRSEALQREAGLEARLNAERLRSEDRERLLGETESRILKGFRDASLTILRRRQQKGLENLNPMPESLDVSGTNVSEGGPSAVAARLRDEVASRMDDQVGPVPKEPCSSRSLGVVQTES